MQAFPTALPAGPQMVARVNPVPRFDFTQTSSGSNYAIGPLDMTRWNALPLTEPTLSYYNSRIGFSSDEVRNFYMLNPTAYQTLFGDNGSNVVPFPFVFGGAADPASVHRYGYRPVDGTTNWFYDWQGTASQKGNVDIRQSVATLTAALASWWHPLPLMARGESTWPLMPSVYVGTRFRYAPFKDGVPWDFYVEGVSHRYVFGGRSATTLTLSRGLPSSIYADASASGLLQAIYTGNARRQYVPGQPGIYQVGFAVRHRARASGVQQPDDGGRSGATDVVRLRDAADAVKLGNIAAQAGEPVCRLVIRSPIGIVYGRNDSGHLTGSGRMPERVGNAP